MSRATRIDGKPRNQWALWMARRARIRTDSVQELHYEQRADEPSHDEKRAIEAAKAREFARTWRAAGGDEALAREYEQRADELERPAAYPWPGGTSRPLAEQVAILLWPDMPVSDAPDAVLHGILSVAQDHKPHLVEQARATLLDGGRSAEYATKQAERAQKTNAQIMALADEVAANRVDNAEPDPFDPVRNGAGEYASPHASPVDDPLAGYRAKPRRGRSKR